MLFVGLLVIAAVVWALIAQPWNAILAAIPTPTPSGSSATVSPAPSASVAIPGETPAPTPDATSTPTAQPCVASELNVIGVTDKEAYAAGENPQLSISLTNLSAADCTLNVGTTTQALTVSSGEDVWWRSTDCQTEPSDMIVLLAAGQTVTSAVPVAWDRTRSSVESCQDPNRPRAPGGATFRLSVEIGGVPSTEFVSFLLN